MRYNFVVVHDLVTTGQIGEALGISHQRVAAIIREANRAKGVDDFPEAEVTLPNGTRLWRRDSALRWFEEHPRRKYEQTGQHSKKDTKAGDQSGLRAAKRAKPIGSRRSSQ